MREELKSDVTSSLAYASGWDKIKNHNFKTQASGNEKPRGIGVSPVRTRQNRNLKDSRFVGSACGVGDRLRIHVSGQTQFPLDPQRKILPCIFQNGAAHVGF
jgi:hypothetical protein